MCRNDSHVTTRFQISIDSGREWYTGTETPASNQWDFLSLITHEFGHSRGFYGHFADYDVCPPTTAESTMCLEQFQGQTRRRTLSVHDIHTFNAAYP